MDTATVGQARRSLPHANATAMNIVSYTGHFQTHKKMRRERKNLVMTYFRWLGFTGHLPNTMKLVRSVGQIPRINYEFGITVVSYKVELRASSVCNWSEA